MGCLFKRFLKVASISIFLLFFLWAAVPAGSWAQTILSQGDVMLINIGSGFSGGFDFVPLVDLSAGTVIRFTDNGYMEANHALGSKEGTITYTASGSVSAGTLLSYSGSNGNGFKQTQGDFSISGSGDNILVFQSTATDTTFLYGAGFARGSSVWTYSNKGSKNRSDIPPPLSFVDNTIVSLGTGNNFQYDVSNGTKGTRLSLFDLVGNESNWSSNNNGAYVPVNADFTLVPSPTIAFSTDAQSVTEGNRVTIAVKLTEAHNANVNVDVNFLGNSSSASSGDIGGHLSSTVHFRNASTGATQNLTFTPPVNKKFKGPKKAVFQLRNNTNGTIVAPNRQTITINKRQTPKVVINEILYDPKGDANHDGTVDAGGDEFVELVNSSGQSLDISNWTLSDGASGGTAKFVFKRGTVIPSQKAFVIFSDSAEGMGFGGAYLFVSTKPLNLDNAGDRVVIKNEQGDVVTSYTYSGSKSGESITRDPDITGNFVGHKSVGAGNGSAFSPGTKIDGTAFDGGYAAALRGTASYRLVSTPAQNTSFSDLFGNLWSQGISGSSAREELRPNIYEWDEPGGSFETIGSMNDAMKPGKGYIIYTNDDPHSPGIQGGFPKTVNTRHAENISPVSVTVSANDDNGDGSIDGTEGYNLLGNPYGSSISVDAVIDALESAVRTGATVNQHAYIWNNATSSYEVLDRSDGLIAPFQAFFVRVTTDRVKAVVSLDRNDLADKEGTQFYKRAAKDVKHFSLRLGHGGKFDRYEVEFSRHGKVGEDKDDAYKWLPLGNQSAQRIQLYSTVGDGVKLGRNILPSLDDLDSDLRISMGFSVPSTGEYTFSWGDLEDTPQKVDLQLVDHKTGREIDLRSSQNYTFNETAAKPINEQRIRKKGRLASPQIENNSMDEDRFDLIIKTLSSTKKIDNSSNEQETKLGPNYPNPFSNYTKLKLTLKQQAEVKATIYNIVGQKVATMIRGKTMDKGDHVMEWSVPPNMPSGIYICKIEAGGKVLTRKMTLVK